MELMGHCHWLTVASSECEWRQQGANRIYVLLSLSLSLYIYMWDPKLMITSRCPLNCPSLFASWIPFICFLYSAATQCFVYNWPIRVVFSTFMDRSDRVCFRNCGKRAKKNIGNNRNHRISWLSFVCCLLVSLPVLSFCSSGTALFSSAIPLQCFRFKLILWPPRRLSWFWVISKPRIYIYIYIYIYVLFMPRTNHHLLRGGWTGKQLLGFVSHRPWMLCAEVLHAETWTREQSKKCRDATTEMREGA